MNTFTHTHTHEASHSLTLLKCCCTMALKSFYIINLLQFASLTIWRHWRRESVLCVRPAWVDGNRCLLSVLYAAVSKYMCGSSALCVYVLCFVCVLIMSRPIMFHAVTMREKVRRTKVLILNFITMPTWTERASERKRDDRVISSVVSQMETLRSDVDGKTSSIQRKQQCVVRTNGTQGKNCYSNS